jgi:hypothetical protein
MVIRKLEFFGFFQRYDELIPTNQPNLTELNGEIILRIFTIR